MRRWAGLSHVPYFEALSEVLETSAEWRARLAGLVGLRLCDVWAQGDPLPVEGLRAFERAIYMMDVDATERAPLEQLASALRMEAQGRCLNGEPAVLARMRDYSEALWQTYELTLAIDTCNTLIEHARSPKELDLVPLVYDRLAICLRATGQLAAALEALQTGRALACARGDLDGDLRLRLSEAALEEQRDNVAAAERILKEVEVDAVHASLPRLAAYALHDRGVLAYKRDDIDQALSLYLRALTDYDVGIDRVLADIALAILELGHRDVAREVLRLLEVHSEEQSQRWTAAINLMRIAGMDRDSELFHSYRSKLARARLTGRHQANYYLLVGDGLIQFGELAAARCALTQADIAIRRYQVDNLKKSWRDSWQNLERKSRSRTRSNGAQETPDSPRPGNATSTGYDLRPLLSLTAAVTAEWRDRRSAVSTAT